jgi:hypothetical protein
LLHPGPKLLLLRGLLFNTRCLPVLGSPLAYSSAPEKSSHTQASSPSIQASCPGGMVPASPGPNSCSVPVVHPYPHTPREHVAHVRTLATLSAAMGLTCSDHLHPGSNTALPTVTSLRKPEKTAHFLLEVASLMSRQRMVPARADELSAELFALRGR